MTRTPHKLHETADPHATALDDFLTGRPMVRQAELARALGVSPSFLSEMATRGDIKVKRIGRLVLIPREEVLRVFGGTD